MWDVFERIGINEKLAGGLPPVFRPRFFASRLEAQFILLKPSR